MLLFVCVSVLVVCHLGFSIFAFVFFVLNVKISGTFLVLRRFEWVEVTLRENSFCLFQ